MFKRILDSYRTVEDENKLELDKEDQEREQIQKIREITQQIQLEEEKFQKKKQKQQQEYYCNQCEKGIKFDQFALDQHLNSIDHKKKVQEFKIRFNKYIRKQKRQLLGRKADPSKKLKKLTFFRKVYQYE